MKSTIKIVLSSILVALMMLGCEGEGGKVVSNSSSSSSIITKLDTNIIEKDSIIIDSLGDTTIIKVKDTVITETKDTVEQTSSQQSSDKSSSSSDITTSSVSSSSSSQIDTTMEHTYKIVDSDYIGTEKYSNIVDELDMALIPAKDRSFMMGLKKHYVGEMLDSTDFMYNSYYKQETEAMPQHKVSFTYNYYIAKYEVSCKEYVDLMNKYMYCIKDSTYPLLNSGYTSDLYNATGTPEMIFSDAGPLTPYEMDYNAVKGKIEIVGNSNSVAASRISWYGAAFYCNMLSKEYNLEEVYDLNTWEADFTKNGFRLPTEAEWEYACRAGTDTPFFWGGIDSYSDNYYYVRQGSKGARPFPNRFGVYDMIGNVSEWCNDYYAPYSNQSEIDPIGPSKSEVEPNELFGDYNKVLRGPAYPEKSFLLSGIRGGSRMVHKTSNGIRVVLPIKDDTK